MHFNYNHLRVFQAVIIHGSTTHAALEVNITQSSVSRNLKEFEDSVGFPLFHRERKGLRPTSEALDLYKDVQRALRTFEDVRQTAQFIANKEKGQLRIAALPAYIDGFISSNLSKFTSKYPGINIQLFAGTKLEIEKWVATEQVDLGVTALPSRTDLIKIRRSVKHTAVCICPSDHPLSVKTSISLEELTKHPYIHQYGTAPLRLLLDQKLAQGGHKSIAHIELESQRSIVNMVNTGGGIGVVDQSILTQQECQQLKTLPFNPSLELSLSYIIAKRAIPSQIAEDFLAWISALHQ